MTVDFEEVKRKNPIELVIAESGRELTGRGIYKNDAHDHSFVVDTRKQIYFQNGGGGEDDFGHDVISYVQHWKRCEVKDAVEWLCQRARMPAPQWGGDTQKAMAQRAQDDVLTVAARVFVRWLRGSEQAQAYTNGRGWSAETVSAAGLGFSGNGTAAERSYLIEALQREGHDIASNPVKAVFAIPPMMLVYPHVRGGRVRYLSARHIAEKRHYNLDAQYVGERQRYYNHEYAPTAELVCLVEGQADAVTLGQWGIAAIALAGNSANDELAEELKRHKHLVVALDFEKAMWEKAKRIAELVGPKTRLLKGLPV